MTETNHLKNLDIIRGFAAFYVVFYHWITPLKFIPESIKKIFFSFGQEAVMLFFILSGFVIYWSVKNTENLTFKPYFIKRFRRIYFPFSLALIISILVFCYNGNLADNFSVREIFGNIFMLQDLAQFKPGTWFNTFLKNYPLWSLSYEWWFYIMFFPCYKLLLNHKYSVYIITAFSGLNGLIYLSYPNQIALICSYYVIWWCGVELGKIFLTQEKFTFNNTKHLIFCLLFMSTLMFIPVLSANELKFGYYPFLVFRHFFVSLLYVIIGLIYTQINIKISFFDKFTDFFALIAPISYGLYIFHYPILMQLNLSNYLPDFLALFVKLFLIIGLSYLTEIKLQPVVNQWLK